MYMYIIIIIILFNDNAPRRQTSPRGRSPRLVHSKLHVYKTTNKKCIQRNGAEKTQKQQKNEENKLNTHQVPA